MMISIRPLVPAALALPLVLAGGPARAADSNAEFGVYEYVLERTGGTIDEAGTAVESALSTEPGSIHDELSAQIKSGLGLP